MASVLLTIFLVYDYLRSKVINHMDIKEGKKIQDDELWYVLDNSVLRRIGATLEALKETV